jgi:hypothetical protein
VNALQLLVASHRMHRQTIVVAVLLVGLVAVPTAQAAKTKHVVTLTVDDARTVGVVGDRLLSLAEAVQVVGGSLPISRLSATEKGKIVGNVASASSRLIKVALRRGAVLQADAAMPVLTGLHDTVIDGGGVLLQPGANGDTPFIVASSRLTIRNFTVIGFGGSVDITPRASVPVLEDITLDSLNLTNSSGNIGINGNGGTVRRVTVSHSRIAGTSGSNNWPCQSDLAPP